jgi:hypothetical protein
LNKIINNIKVLLDNIFQNRNIYNIAIDNLMELNCFMVSFSNISYNGPLELYLFLSSYTFPAYRENENNNIFTYNKKHTFTFKRKCNLTQSKLNEYIIWYEDEILENIGYIGPIIITLRSFINENIKTLVNEIKRIIQISLQYKLQQEAIAFNKKITHLKISNY